MTNKPIPKTPNKYPGTREPDEHGPILLTKAEFKKLRSPYLSTFGVGGVLLLGGQVLILWMLSNHVVGNGSRSVLSDATTVFIAIGTFTMSWGVRLTRAHEMMDKLKVLEHLGVTREEFLDAF